MKRFFLALLTLGLLAVLLLSWVQKGTAEADILSGAQARIEKYRKSDALVRVISSTGKPVVGAKVHVEQLRHAFLFGGNGFALLKYKDPQQEAMYEKEFSSLFNYATLPFYWSIYEPKRGQEDYVRQEQQARWFINHGITPKGHPLVWHSHFPKWVSSEVDVAKQEIREHVNTIVTRFKGLIDYWDVVNEANSSSKIDNPESRWIARDGAAAVVGDALQWARTANPDAYLIYNDFKIIPQLDYEKLAQNLVASKKPVDVFGIQSHMLTSEWPITKIWNVCETYSRFGKPLHFTEVTIISGEHGYDMPLPWSSTPAGEAVQADYVEKFYTVLFSHPAVEAITWWDMPDPAWRGSPGGLVHEDLSPKPAYLRLMKLIKGDWWTRTDLVTDNAGKASFRGFLGHYRITVTTPTGTKTQEVNLEQRSKSNTFEVRLS